MKKKNRSLYIIALLAVILLIGIGYAALTSKLSITGNTKINKQSWKVYISGISSSMDSNSTVTRTFEIYKPNETTPVSEYQNTDDGKTGFLSFSYNYKATPLSGTWFTANDKLYITIKNAGTIDAYVRNVNLPTSGLSGISEVSCYWGEIGSYSSSAITSTTATPAIKAGESKTITCRHTFSGTSWLSDTNISNMQTYTSDEIIVPFNFSIDLYAY